MQAIFNAGTAISLSEIRDTINDESNMNIINPEVKIVLTEHFAEKIQFCPSERANEPLFVFSSLICANDVVERLHSLDTTKNVAEKFRKSFLEKDFELNDKFCDGEDLLGSCDNLSLTDEILTFLGILFTINPEKPLPKYPEKYPSITLHRCSILVIIMTKVTVIIVTLLFQMMMKVMN